LLETPERSGAMGAPERLRRFFMRNVSKSILKSVAVLASISAFGLGGGIATAASDNDISAAKAKMRIDDLKVGTELGTNGSVLDNKDDIKAGERVYASIKVTELGIGTPIKAIWKGPHDARMFEEVKSVVAGASYLVFMAPDTTAWKPGEYRVEIRLADELGGKEDFKIRESPVN
jgi:hypothetical protein